MVEFGAGSQTKTPLLLRAVHPRAYVPIDISGDYLEGQRRVRSTRTMRGSMCSRWSPTSPSRSTCPTRFGRMTRLGFFPGSTIGNFVPRSATDLLRHFRDILGTGAKLLIGMDRIKPVERLHRRL